MTGWTTNEAIGQPLSMVFHIINENTRKPVDHPAELVLRTGHIVGLANHTVLIDRNGAERPIADSAAPIRDADDRIIGVVLV
jgi:PAS domain S-box-containing protein